MNPLALTRLVLSCPDGLDTGRMVRAMDDLSPAVEEAEVALWVEVDCTGLSRRLVVTPAGLAAVLSAPMGGAVGEA